VIQLEDLSANWRRVLVKHLYYIKLCISVRIKCNAIGAVYKVTLGGRNSVLFGQGCKVGLHLINRLIRKYSMSRSSPDL